MNVHLSGARYKEDAGVLAFYDRALELVRAMPGVRSAAVVSQLPLGTNFDAYGVHAEDRPSKNPETDPSADRFSVSSDYLRTMRIPVLRGRDFSGSDRAGSLPVVLVNQALARRYWGTDTVVGKRVKVGGMDGPWRTVVGVVGNVRHRGLDAPTSLQIYLPQGQFSADNDMTLVIRADRAAGRLGEAAARQVRKLDRDQVVDGVATMDQTRASSAGNRRFAAILLNSFAGIAIVLAVIGIYGVISNTVLQRTREFGIRLALGATRGSILRLVASGSLRWIGAGLVIGVSAALASMQLLASELYGIGPRDPLTLAVVLAATAVVTLAASLVPARRATRVDPAATLRHS
jgi:putative ABC transport system permease protein